LRIQTSEMMATPDAEMVLRVLEWSLREISVEVVRDGRRITVRGLGPSQRTMNRNDITVVEVACENRHTIIRADITYQASALLGGASQDDLVRSKLDRVLDHVKMELGTQRVRVEELPWLADPVLGPEAGFEPEHLIEPAYAPEPKPSVEAEHGFEPEAGRDSEHFIEIEPARAAEPVVVSEQVRESEPEVVAAGGDSVALPVTAEPVPVAAAAEKLTSASASSSRVQIPMFQTFHPEDARKPKRWGLLATVVCMLAAVAIYLAWPYLVGLVHERSNPSSGVAEESVAGETAKLPADKVPMQVPDTNAAVGRNASSYSEIHDESDPKIWLESWADAMRQQDASAQASFYADPVEHYALKSNVSNADVWLDKQNAIQSRPKVWTVQLEDVVVEPRPDESMRVRLTKHYISKSDAGKVSEQLVHSQLKLRKIDGQWKITSEQNLRP
jgi:ketosteroid isomerase-like protein